MKWLIPLVAVLVLGFLGMQYLGNDEDAVSESVSDVQNTATQAAGNSATDVQTSVQNTVADTVQNASALSAEALQAAQASMPAGIDLASLTGSLESVFGSTSDALSGITDVESARTAVSGIEAASDKLSGLKSVITRLPDAANGPINAIVSNGMASLKPLIDKVTAIPGVAELVQPVLGPMLETLQGLTS